MPTGQESGIEGPSVAQIDQSEFETSININIDRRFERAPYDKITNSVLHPSPRQPRRGAEKWAVKPV